MHYDKQKCYNLAKIKRNVLFLRIILCNLLISTPKMKWTKQKLSKVFGLKQVKWHPTLDDWLRTPTNVSEAEKTFLSILRENCLERIDDFNARELILKIVGPTISCVNFDTEKFTAIRKKMMVIDNSWEGSAEKYINLYTSLR